MPNSLHLSRRTLLTGIAAAAGTSAVKAMAAESGEQRGSAAQSGRPDVIVVGSGVFGAWTAWHLLKLGRKVLLLDAWGPAHARASSGGESRMTRTVYGRDEIYTRFALESLDEWRWLSGRSGLPIFHPTGVVFLFGRREPYVTQSIEVHQRLNIPLEVLDRAALAKRFPQIALDGVELGLFEQDRGVLMARRSVLTLVTEYVAAGGQYRQAAIVPPKPDAAFDSIQTTAGETLSASRFVFACGPWLPKVFPDILGTKIFPTRQEVFFFAPDAGDTRFEAAQLPGWADFNDGDIYYGMPDLESRGLKIAHDRHGPPIDPDTGDRLPTSKAIADVREFIKRRFPALANRPVVESRVCQYENSSNGDFLIDRHPQWENVVLVGAGSGHGFKHGPAVGKYAAQLVTGTRKEIEPRFSLQSKAAQQRRDVH
ncbi:MAG TPA: FAD-dependent oxidoreductase [Steroidobacteraceae bacterium]